MSRPSSVVVDLHALRANYQLARQLHGGRALAVIKANAYGHGAIACAKALAPHVDGFAVAILDEACALRESGVTNPILILEGAFDDTEVQRAARLDLWLVIHNDEQIRMLMRTPTLPRQLNAWLKIDSGMRRAGFDCGSASSAYERLLGTGKVRSVTLMTHFACADQLDQEFTTQQIERFDAATRELPGERSLCNSAGLLWSPSARRSWARPGLMLYGIAPDGRELRSLQPAMTFKSTVVAVRKVQPGESIGYGATFVARRTMTVGLVCVGYADGYPQTAPSGTPIAVDGQRTSVVGRVSMDMLTVDLTDLPNSGIGSDVELWGRTIGANEVARASNRIAYEMLCSVKRAPFIYIDNVVHPRFDVHHPEMELSNPRARASLQLANT